MGKKGNNNKGGAGDSKKQAKNQD
jgi:hypothetical protein